MKEGIHIPQEVSGSGPANVYIVSDSLGETAERVVRAAATQFNGKDFKIHRYSYVKSSETVDQVVAKAASEGSAVVVHTLVLSDLRERLERLCRDQRIRTVDLMGPMLEAFTAVTKREPKLLPGLIHKLDREYFKMVEAIEFAVKYDDGRDPEGILRADLVLIGVSRTSKTPLSMFLAHKGYKVANVPLVPEIRPPEQLYQIPPTRIVGLLISPDNLVRIRRARLKSLGLDDDADYASPTRIMRELDYARQVMQEIGCPIVDVTGKAVEETAVQILSIIKRRDAR